MSSRRGKRRSLKLPIVIGLVALVAVAGYFIFEGSTLQSSPLIGQPASPTVLAQIADVSNTTLSQINNADIEVAAPTGTGVNSSQYLTLNGKPEVLYIGGEFCPYCGIERWSMIMALDRFGTFSGLTYMQSESSDIYADTYTFSFLNATYTSKYIALVTVEEYDRNHNPLQTPTSAEAALVHKYDDNPSTNGSIPFVDFGNKYILVGSQAVPSVLRVGGSATGAPYNWTTIASQLNTPSSKIAQAIDASADDLIAAICDIDGGQPSSLCTQNFAQVVSYAGSPYSGQLMAPDSVFVGRAVPTRMLS